MSVIVIEDACSNDAVAMAEIYNDYVENSLATFDEDILSVEEMSKRIDRVHDQALPWIVAVSGNEMLGYAYASQWKNRSAYRFCAEITVYIARGKQSQGVGSLLYKHLFPRLRSCGTRVAIACLSLPNDASVALHEKFGMKKVGHFCQVGFKFNQWVDIGYWQLDLDILDREMNVLPKR